AAEDALFAIFEIVEGGDKNDRRFFVVGQRAQFFAQLKSGEARHVDVQQHEVVIVLLEHREGDGRVDGAVGGEVGALQRGHGDVVADFVVIHGKHARFGQRVHAIDGGIREQDAQTIGGLGKSLQNGGRNH